jgi:hypothetical protein
MGKFVEFLKKKTLNFIYILFSCLYVWAFFNSTFEYIKYVNNLLIPYYVMAWISAVFTILGFIGISTICDKINSNKRLNESDEKIKKQIEGAKLKLSVFDKIYNYLYYLVTFIVIIIALMTKSYFIAIPLLLIILANNTSEKLVKEYHKKHSIEGIKEVDKK